MVGQARRDRPTRYGYFPNSSKTLVQQEVVETVKEVFHTTDIQISTEGGDT